MENLFHSSPHFWNLGSLNGCLYTQDQGVVVYDNTYVAKRKDTKDVVFVGKEACALLEKMSTHFVISPALENGVIADEVVLRNVVMEWKKQVHSKNIPSLLFSQTACVAVPAFIHPTHIRAMKRAFADCGYGKVTFLPEELCILAYHAIDNVQGTACILDSGAGKTVLSCVSGGSVIGFEKISEAGNVLDENIRVFFNETHGIEISLQDARRMKQTLSFVDSKKKSGLILRGKNKKKNTIESVAVRDEELAHVFIEFLEKVMVAFHALLEKVPSEVAEVMSAQGILLSGGLSKNEHVKTWLEHTLQIPVSCVARPDTTSVVGAARLYSAWDKYSYMRIPTNG